MLNELNKSLSVVDELLPIWIFAGAIFGLIVGKFTNILPAYIDLLIPPTLIALVTASMVRLHHLKGHRFIKFSQGVGYSLGF